MRDWLVFDIMCLVPLAVSQPCLSVAFPCSISSFSSLMARKVTRVTCAKITFSTNRRNTGCKPELFLKKRKIFFRGGEAVVEPWEDELLWDDDYSDEEEDAEEQIEETGLEMAADS